MAQDQVQEPSRSSSSGDTPTRPGRGRGSAPCCWGPRGRRTAVRGQGRHRLRREVCFGARRAAAGAFGPTDPPFTAGLARAQKNAHWVRPELVAEVEFTEWTRDGGIRHPSFKGLREDKPASTEVRCGGARRTRMSMGAADPAREPARGAGRRRGRASPTQTGSSGPPRESPSRTSSATTAWWPSACSPTCSTGRSPWCVARAASRTGRFEAPSAGAAAGLLLPQAPCRRLPRYLRPGDDHRIGRPRPVPDHHRPGKPHRSRPDGRARDPHLGVDVAGHRAARHCWCSTSTPAPASSGRPLPTEHGSCARCSVPCSLESFVKTTGGKGLHVVVPLTPNEGWKEVGLFCRRVAEIWCEALSGPFHRQHVQGQAAGQDLR